MQPRLILIGAFSAVVALFGFILWRMQTPETDFVPTTEGDKAIAAAVDKLNEGLPSLVDEETALVKAVAGPNSATFLHRLTNLRKSDIPADAQNTLEPIVRAGACTSDELKLYRDLKATLTYRYYDRDGVFVLEFSIDTGSCP